MSRAPESKVGLVILIALAAFFLVRVHAAGGAKLGNASEGHRLAEAWCKPCHAIEPHMAGVLDQAPSFEAIANRHGTTALSLRCF
jgi:cytochrome c